MIPINPEAIGDPNATPVVYLGEEAGKVLGIRQRAGAVVCKSTGFGEGCGHPVTDHDGDGTRMCCCCNRNLNSEAHAETCLRCQIKHIKRRLGVTTMRADELAALLPQHLRQPFWRDAIERYLSEQLAAAHLSTDRPDQEGAA